MKFSVEKLYYIFYFLYIVNINCNNKILINYNIVYINI